MSGPQKTLVAIALFVALAVGGFIWFVTQWEPGQTNTSFTWQDKPWGELAAGQGGQGPHTPNTAGHPA